MTDLNFEPLSQTSYFLIPIKIDLDGNNLNKISNDKTVKAWRNPVFSSDGRKIYFDTKRGSSDNNYHLFFLDIKTKEVGQITYE